MDRKLWQYQINIIMVGSICVGKSCMASCYTEGMFPESVAANPAVGFCSRVLEMEPGVRLKVDLFDPPGMERAWSYTIPFISGSAGCLLVFDVGNENSFRDIKMRHKQVCELIYPYTMIFVMVGNKTDQNKRTVSQEDAKRLASELGVQYIETSAKTGQNVEEAFRLLTWTIYQGFLCGQVKTQGVSCSKKSTTPKNIHNNDKNKCCAF